MDGMPKKPCGRKQHAPTDAQRQLVQLHATVGTTQDMIARVIGIDKKTLRKYYRDELDLSMAKANATIGGALFNTNLILAGRQVLSPPSLFWFLFYPSYKLYGRLLFPASLLCAPLIICVSATPYPLPYGHGCLFSIRA